MVVHLGWVDINFGRSATCLILLGQLEVWQNELGRVIEYRNPNLGARQHAHPCTISICDSFLGLPNKSKLYPKCYEKSPFRRQYFLFQRLMHRLLDLRLPSTASWATPWSAAGSGKLIFTPKESSDFEGSLSRPLLSNILISIVCFHMWCPQLFYVFWPPASPCPNSELIYKLKLTQPS